MSVSNERLLDALRHLAMSAEEQITYLRDLGVAPSADELALELDDSIGDVSPEVQERIRALDNYLQAMSGAEHASLWSFDALRNSTRWREVRRMAVQALESLECESRS